MSADPERAEFIDSLSVDELLKLYESLVTARLHDIHLKRWVRQGVITKAWLGSGEEAITVGACAALGDDDVVGPMIRNASALIERGMPLNECFSAYLGTTDNVTQGRDLHTGDITKGIIPPISHIGDLVPVMVGCALAFRLDGSNRLALTWTGDGSTATGAFHEGMRMAAATKAPFICIVQNNLLLWAPKSMCTARVHELPTAMAYGFKTLTMDGNNILDCYAACRIATEACRRGEGPVYIYTETFRMGGHATHDEREARELFDDATYAYWGKRDPVGMYEEWLKSVKGVAQDTLEKIEQAVDDKIERAAKLALERRTTHLPDPSTQGDGVYA